MFVGATHSSSKTGVNALVVVARGARVRGEAGGHKARPYEPKPFPLVEAHDQRIFHLGLSYRLENPHFCGGLKYLKSGGAWSFLAGISNPSAPLT